MPGWGTRAEQNNWRTVESVSDPSGGRGTSRSGSGELCENSRPRCSNQTYVDSAANGKKVNAVIVRAGLSRTEPVHWYAYAGNTERTLRRARERICQRPRRVDDHWVWALAASENRYHGGHLRWRSILRGARRAPGGWGGVVLLKVSTSGHLPQGGHVEL